jgi:sugar lactone lactonase YvrE
MNTYDFVPEITADYACEIGENPLWHPHEGKLYWTDMPARRLFRFDPRTGSHEEIYHGWPVGGFTFEADGGLLLFRDQGNIAHWRDDEQLIDTRELTSRIVSAICKQLAHRRQNQPIRFATPDRTKGCDASIKATLSN